MTEYDYSPEAYERYMQTQKRISNWVDKTEGCRPLFTNALAPPSDYLPGHDDMDSRHHDRPGRRLQRRHSQHFRSRSPSEYSSSSDGSYDDDDYVPIRPSPPMRSAPAHLGGGFPAQQLPWNQPPRPMAHHSRTMPPSYYGAPSYQQVKQRRMHSYGPQAPYTGHYGSAAHPPAPPPRVVYVSPPVSPGVYGYPTPPQSYVMPVGQRHGRPGPMPVMYIPQPC